MTERIKRICDKIGGISDFKINTKKKESYEVFFVHNRTETVRSTDTVIAPFKRRCFMPIFI